METLNSAECMQGELARKVQQDGFVFLKDYEPEKNASDIISFFGEADSLGIHGPVHELKPTSIESSSPNTYSGNYGFGVFPLHTDMAHWQVPPRFLMLRCLVGSSEVPTSLVDGLLAIQKVGKLALSRALVKPRRRLQGKCSMLRLYERDYGDGFLRWDEKYILPASPAGKAGMTELRKTLVKLPRRDIYLTRPGDTLIIDNWRMMHGRGSVTPNASNRSIARAYLKSVH